MSANDSDEGHHNGDDDINCDHFSNKNLTFSSYFYKAILDHDGGKILPDIIPKILLSLDLILMMDSSSQRFFRKIFSRYNTIPKYQFTSQTYSPGDVISFKNK